MKIKIQHTQICGTQLKPCCEGNLHHQVHIFIRKEEKSQISDLGSTLKNWEKRRAKEIENKQKINK